MTGLAAGATLAVGFYILYGPTTTPRRKRLDVKGLTNTGNYCFVNAILQALASCPTLYYWLQDMVTSNDDRSVGGSLYRVLSILNNLETKPVSDPYSPNLVLASLRSHGWVINTEEQDAHEMLHVVMNTLEEEIEAKKISNKPSHASLLDLSNIGLDDDLDSNQELEEESHKSLPFEVNHRGRSPFLRGQSLPPEISSPSMPVAMPFRETVSRETSPVGSRFRRRHRRKSSGVFTKTGEELSLDVVVSITKGAAPTQSPFTGLLTNKVSYSSGKSKSPVTYSSFNNITLNLPTPTIGVVTLDTLLQMFISQESIEGSCKKQENSTNFIKQLTFGKLPDCLCFHIQRTGFSGGQPYKKHDFVEFPVMLSMEKFVYSRQLAKQKSVTNLAKQKVDLANSASGGGEEGKCQVANIYTLRAVVVHMGGIASGHYITYRKGPLGSRTSHKWYYTSDTLVKQVPFSEVSRSCAYMLFYEKDTDLDTLS